MSLVLITVWIMLFGNHLLILLSNVMAQKLNSQVDVLWYPGHSLWWTILGHIIKSNVHFDILFLAFEHLQIQRSHKNGNNAHTLFLLHTSSNFRRLGWKKDGRVANLNEWSSALKCRHSYLWCVILRVDAPFLANVDGKICGHFRGGKFSSSLFSQWIVSTDV